jgi:rhamnosyltransferase
MPGDAAAPARASIIVRAGNSRAHLEQLLPLLRKQSVPLELIVVDSGSSDGSSQLARRLADQVVALAPGTYTPGRSLNAGAAAASGEVMFALSSHCRPADSEWVERALRHYADPRVVATNGSPCGPDGRPFAGVFLQDAAHARAHPHWGFSNHASSWRTAAWRELPFDEEVTTAEDRLWAIEMTRRGWAIAFDPSLWVEPAHRWKNGALNFLRRERRELIVIGTYAALPAYTRPMLVRDWWRQIPEDRHCAAFHRLLNYRRAAGLVGKYLGHTEARRTRRFVP